MEKCKYFKDYQAIYPPRCGCQACNDKWNKKQEENRRRQDEDLMMAVAVMTATIISCM
jgi:hypothetical protein